MTVVFFSLGSNVSPETNLRLGIRELERRYGEVRRSPVYRNRAHGFEGPEFLNMVARCEVDCSLRRLLQDIEAIHDLAGRDRGGAKFADRTLDIDVLTYGREIRGAPGAVLPREDILRYSFVLKPLADLAPDETHPQTGRSFAEHWSEWTDDHALTPVALDFPTSRDSDRRRSRRSVR